MLKDYAVHWIFGLAAVIVAFWGDKLAIPAQYVTAAGALLPAIVGHALAFEPTTDVKPQAAPVAASDSTTTQG
jgi:hypothetical protein